MTKSQYDEPMSAERAKKQFKEIIDMMKQMTCELMKTRSGRDSIRRDLGCGIEGFEEEDKEWFSHHPWSQHR